ETLRAHRRFDISYLGARQKLASNLWCPQQHKAESPMGSIISYAPFSLSGREMTGMPLKSGKKIKKIKKRKFEIGGDFDRSGFRFGFGVGFGQGFINSLWFAAPSLTATESVIDVDSYSGDTVGRQGFHRLAFFMIGGNAALPGDLSDQSIIPPLLFYLCLVFSYPFPKHFFTSPPLSISTLSHHSYTFSLSIFFLYSLKIHGFTLSLLLNMNHPYEEMKEMKRLKKHYDMLGFVADAQYGIPTRCPCGGEIMTNVSPTPKYKSDFDTLPGSRYFTCKNYEDDGLHFRQPWAFGVQQEVERLRREVKELAEEIAKLKRLITSTSRP
ncbi:hypothetical protein IGI04_007605, partial [Brassica rapa subsp. trilocularis]